MEKTDVSKRIRWWFQKIRCLPKSFYGFLTEKTNEESKKELTEKQEEAKTA